MPSLSLLATRVSVRNMEVVDDVCRSWYGCGGLDHATIALVVLTGVVALLVLAAIVHLSDAVSVVHEERSRLADERDAFDAFARRLANMEVTETTAAAQAAGGISTTTTVGNDGGLESVRSAYRDTVMSVDHYGADYDEPLATNLAAELGEDVAVAVLDGDRLTPPLRTALLSAAREASHNRQVFLQTLESEAEALDDAASAIRAIDEERAAIDETPPTGRSYGELVDDWRRLGDLLERCQSLAEDRQQRLRQLAQARSPSDMDLREYLYEDLPTTHPVLADVTETAEAVRSLRSRLLRSITRRV